MKKNWLPMLLLWLMLASCSYSFIYNQLDFILLQYADSMVSLDESLYSQLKTSTRRLHQWHRQTQLPQYLIWLEAIRETDKKAFTDAHIQQLNKRLNEFYSSIMQHFFTELVELMPQMSQLELDELFDNLHESNQEFYEDYVDISKKERIEKYEENMIESYQTMLGDLNRQQNIIIHAAVTQLIHTAEFRYQNRLNFQNSMRQVLYADESLSTKRKLFQQLLDDTFIHSQAEPQQLHNSGVVLKSIHKMMAVADDKQILHLRQEIDQYTAMIKRLITNNKK